MLTQLPVPGRWVSWLFGRNGRQVCGNHLPVVSPLCKDNCESQLRPWPSLLSFREATADRDRSVTENAHLDVLGADRKTVPSGCALLRNDVSLVNHSSSRRGAYKIIGDDLVQSSAILTFIGVKPRLNCLQDRLLRTVLGFRGLQCRLGKRRG